MRKDRLLKLADYLETVPRGKFAMDTWVREDAQTKNGNAKRGCGFAGCAIGWATHGRLFKGLAFKREAFGNLFEPWPYYDGQEGFDGLSILFEIEWHEASALFSPRMDVPHETPKQVAKRIRKFVKDAG